jgi:hypothetical protein
MGRVLARSEPFGPGQRAGEIDEEESGDGAADEEIERHGGPHSRSSERIEAAAATKKPTASAMERMSSMGGSGFQERPI